MAFIRCCMLTVGWVFCMLCTNAQKVYYPVGSSQLLKATANDVAQLLQKAITGSTIAIEQYTTLPTNGIILIYDATINGNQTCAVKSNGTSITFKAAEDNGLVFGIYQYIQKLGYKFYQPGSIWEIVPTLNSPYQQIDTLFTSTYKYKTWFISGGCNRWVMDNNANYGWDTYFGENGHNWSLYQRRNGMIGEYGFTGHRGDIMNTTYLNTLQNNPCFVASYNGVRKPSSQSVPDISNTAAVELWGTTIEQRYTSYKNIIQGNPVLYANQIRNFKFGTQHIGIEVPDGAEWGNSSLVNSPTTCTNTTYPSESDQQFLLANKTAEKINAVYPDKKFQLYAYSTHANIPSASIQINKNIDVQLIPTVYQLETSTNGLRNRWYNKFDNISEYHYLNLSGWSGETPQFSWTELKQTLQLAKNKKLQGLVWEASPAKFGSLPYLFAANNFLKEGVEVDKSVQDFCANMFGAASSTVYKMLQMFGSDNEAPAKHKIQLYIELLQKATQQTQTENTLVKSRLAELKAYLHYMGLYYDLTTNNYSASIKKDKEGAICMYLAKVNKMQLVNSYYLINLLASKYGITNEFYKKYNSSNGTAYNNGTISLLTNAEIENNFLQDVATYSNQLNNFIFSEDENVKEQFEKNGVQALDKINIHLSYTNGLNYYNKTSFNIIANKANSFTLQYTPRFDNKSKGYLNFLVEAADETFKIVKDFTITEINGAGTLKIDLPAGGKYLLTIVSKHQTAVDLTITTNGNYFYKKGNILSSATESYVTDAKSLPTFFYVPNGLQKVYFTLSNTFLHGKYLTPETISKNFSIKNKSGANNIKPKLVTPKDSALFYVEIPSNAQGDFWQIQTNNQYYVQFVNSSNLLWYAHSITTNKAAPAVTEAEEFTAKAFPNPSKGAYACIQNNRQVIANEIVVINAQGIKAAQFKNTNQFNISNLPAGVYFYTMNIGGKIFNGKLIKI